MVLPPPLSLHHRSPSRCRCVQLWRCRVVVGGGGDTGCCCCSSVGSRSDVDVDWRRVFLLATLCSAFMVLFLVLCPQRLALSLTAMEQRLAAREAEFAAAQQRAASAADFDLHVRTSRFVGFSCVWRYHTHLPVVRQRDACIPCLISVTMSSK